MPVEAQHEAQHEAFLKLDTGTHTGDILQIAVTPDGRQIVTAGECTIRIWDTQTRQLVRMLLGQVSDRSQEVFGDGNVLRFALSPDGRWIVVLKDWLTGMGERGDGGFVTELQVFERDTGNLQSRYVHRGLLFDLDFSPDGRYLAVVGNQVVGRRRRVQVQVYSARDVVKAGFKKPPQPLFAQAFQSTAGANGLPASLRFVPVVPQRGAAYTLVVAASSQPPDDKVSEARAPDNGWLSWVHLLPAQGLVEARSVRTEGPVVPHTLAVSHDWSVVAAAGTTRCGRQHLGRLLRHSHDGQDIGCTFTEAPPAAAVFSPSGGQLLLGLSTQPDNDGLMAPGEQTVQVNAYSVSCSGLDLRSSYFGHDGTVHGLAFLGDGTAISAGGDNQAIHFWDCRHRVGQLLGAIRGVGQTMFAPGITRAEQVLFGSVPLRLLPPNHAQRQQTFCLHSMTLQTTEPSAVRQTDYETRKWFIADHASQLIPLRHSPSAYGQDLDLPPDLTLFVGADDEWVLWTRSGYYNASPNGARRIGYHVNRGVDKEALFVPSDRFKDCLRPDIVQAVVQHGSEERARARGVNIDALDVKAMLPPLIELAPRGVVAGTDQVSFNFTTWSPNAAQPVTRVWILRNGNFAWNEALPSGKGKGPTRHRVKLPLRPGRNVFSIRAETARTRAASIDWELAGPPLPPQGPLAVDARGKLFLLSVGVSDFAVAHTEAAQGTRPLLCAHKDAAAVHRALAGPGRGRRNKAFDGVEAVLLVNEQATKANILGQLQRLCTLIQQRGQAEGDERDVLFVFLSGHGLRFKGEPDLYFFNHDMVPLQAELHGLSMLALGELMATVPAEVVLVIDACHAGMAGNNVVSGLDPQELAQRIHAVSERGLYVLGAARAEEKAREDREGGLGVFTQALLHALRSPRHLAPDGAGRKTRSISMMGLIAGLQEELPRVSARAGTRAQTPVCRMYGDLLPLTIYRE